MLFPQYKLNSSFENTETIVQQFKPEIASDGKNSTFLSDV